MRRVAAGGLRRRLALWAQPLVKPIAHEGDVLLELRRVRRPSKARRLVRVGVRIRQP